MRIRRRSIFSPTSRITQEREIQVPTSYIQDAPSKIFFLQVKKAKDFFFYRRATYKDTYVEAYEFRQSWSVAKIRGTRKLRRRPRKVVCLRKKGTSETRKEKRPRKARRWLREGKVPCVLNQEISFFWLTSIWALRDPSCLNIGPYET